MNRLSTYARTFFLFLCCLLLGTLGGSFFLQLSDTLRGLVAQHYPEMRPDVAQALKAMEPQLSRMVFGLAVFGLGAYLLASLALGGFARSLLQALEKRLRDRDLMPYSYAARRKRRTLVAAQEGIFSLFDSYVEQLQGANSEMKRYKEALNTYADPTVAARLKDAQFGSQTIKTQRRAVAVLFADIRGFTTMSEVLMPEQVELILNDYFTFSTIAIRKNGGTVNKFIGDAVMALFEQGPAYREANASKSAILAALEMQEEFSRFLTVWKNRIPQRFDAGLGVGINYGEAILGTLGSPERMEYTAIGDTVNYSSRLCSLAEATEVRVSEDCFERVQGDFDGRSCEPVAVKGKAGMHVTYVVSRKRVFGR